MLRLLNCVSNLNCEACSFRNECIEQRIKFSKMIIPSRYAQGDPSVGYIIECEDDSTRVKAGYLMRFNIILFGYTIVYFNQILNAIYALGQSGLGKEEAKFNIVSITNSDKEPLLYGNDDLRRNVKVNLVSEYIKDRRSQIENEPLNNIIRFRTPTCIKVRGDKQNDFDVSAFFKSLQRRIYNLDCFEGIESHVIENDMADLPSIKEKKLSIDSKGHYSKRIESGYTLNGITGSVKLSSIPDPLMDLLLAGELLHVGNSISYGFGGYIVE